jgi:endonuclease/exonuclease/phosphatase family metal-dependent hydrolase
VARTSSRSRRFASAARGQGRSIRRPPWHPGSAWICISSPRSASFEKRSALWVAVEVDGQTIHVVNAHLSLRSGERRAQAAALIGPDWVGHPDCADPAVLLGDFNAPPYSRSYRLIANRMLDAQLSNSFGEPQPTFHTRAPVLRLDHVFVTKSIEVVDAGPVRNPLTQVASDHFPLLAELRVRKRLGVSTGSQAREGELL